MMRMVEPKAGLEQSCREMLGQMYDQAFEHGYDQATLDIHTLKKGESE